jgi:TatD DNase family protein
MTIGYEYRPETLYLNVTNRCSNNCTFCVRQSPDFSLAGFDMRLEKEPTVEEVLADISRQQAVRGRPFQEVVFCGFGEPTYRLELIHTVGQNLREQGRRVRLNTNGQAALINERDPLPELEEALDEVSISLNAPEGKTYAALCRPSFGEAAYPAVLDFIRRCAGRFEAVTVTVVGFTLEREDLARCERIAGELGAGFRVR